jgi:uroporphyrinogen decarboxylase
MNTRERFLAVMDFGPVDRALLWESPCWAGTLRRWYGEGLPRRTGCPDELADGQTAPSEDMRRFFQLDPPLQMVPLEVYIYPPFEEKILEDHGDWVLKVDKWGVTLRQAVNGKSLPDFVSGPVSTREDWEQLKAERLRPTLRDRLGENWPTIRDKLRRRDYPLAIGGDVGFFGMLRFMMGVEPLLLAYYDQPDLIRDMVSYLADFYVSLFDQALDELDVDAAIMWEDMCYKTGPLISPDMFRRFMLPAYQQVTSMLRSRGVRHVIADTDGNCWSLLPLFVEAGVTGLYPFEVAAGMDVTQVRDKFGRLQILGGIDKRAIAAGPSAIDAELQAKVPFMLKRGGYVPHVDHGIAPDISWDHFVYYRSRLNEMIRSAGG